MDITIPNSIYIDGQWFAATWLAEIVDDTTGELIITATIKEPARVAALRLTNDMMSDLRTQAGFTGPTPAQRAATAAAELAYMRESVQFAADMLFRGRSQMINWPNDALNAEAYLRQLLTPDPSNPSAPSAPCYDCRTTGQRIDAIEAGLPPQFQVEARRMRARMRYVADVLRSARRMLDTPTVDEVDGLLLHAIGQLRMADGKDGADGSGGECYDCRTTGQRLDALESEQRIASQTLHASLNEIERRLAVEYGDSATRLDALETWQVETDDKLSIVDARAQNDAVAGAERLAALEAWQVAVAMDTAEDNSLFQIYDAVARRERAKGGA